MPTDPNFWNEVRKAAEVVMTSGVRKAEGRGFKVYRVGDGLIRIDIPLEQEGGNK